MAKLELPHVRTELLELLVIPLSAPHPIQPYCQFAGHGYFGDGLMATQRDVRIRTSPLRVTAGYYLRRLPQQVPKQRIALLADVAQTPAIGTGVLAGNQSQRAGHLLAATKSIRSA